MTNDLSVERSMSAKTNAPWWAWFPWPLIVAWVCSIALGADSNMLANRALALLGFIQAAGAFGTIWLATRLRAPRVPVPGPGVCFRCLQTLGPPESHAPPPARCPECGLHDPKWNQFFRPPMPLGEAVVAGILVGVAVLHLLFAVALFVMGIMLPMA